MPRSRLLMVGVTAALAVAALAGCGASKTKTPTEPSAPGAGNATATGSGSAAGTLGGECVPDRLALVAPGTLTIGTDKPAYEPWFKDDNPASGQGYESAVAYAIADRLGFAKDKVSWTTVTFNAAIAPGKKKFDFDVNQISISDERKGAVDFSAGYYDVRQAVVTTKGSKADGKAAIADLKGVKLGAQVGTTSYAAIEKQIQPHDKPAVFDSNDLAVAALKSKQVDAIVVDVPTAFYMAAAQLDNGVIVGQLPQVGDATEQFGAVLSKGSPMTACVSKAVNALRADGTLTRLQEQWLTKSGAPELT